MAFAKWCCQVCGREIGYLGRFLQRIGLQTHSCGEVPIRIGLASQKLISIESNLKRNPKRQEIL